MLEYCSSRDFTAVLSLFNTSQKSRVETEERSRTYSLSLVPLVNSILCLKFSLNCFCCYHFAFFLGKIWSTSPQKHAPFRVKQNEIQGGFILFPVNTLASDLWVSVWCHRTASVCVGDARRLSAACWKLNVLYVCVLAACLMFHMVKSCCGHSLNHLCFNVTTQRFAFLPAINKSYSHTNTVKVHMRVKAPHLIRLQMYYRLAFVYVCVQQRRVVWQHTERPQRLLTWTGRNKVFKSNVGALLWCNTKFRSADW